MEQSNNIETNVEPGKKKGKNHGLSGYTLITLRTTKLGKHKLIRPHGSSRKYYKMASGRKN